MQYITNISQMQQISSGLGNNAKKLKRCNQSVNGVRVNIPGVNSIISRIANEIDDEYRILKQMTDMLNDGMSLYCKYERQIAALKKQSIDQDVQDSPTGKEENKSLLDYTVNWSNLWKLTGTAGAIGGVVSAVGTIVTGSGKVKDYISATKYLCSAAGTGAVAISKGGAEGWKYAAGFNDALAKIKPGTFGQNVKASVTNQLDDLKFSNATNGASKFKTATKWAGHILTVAANGVENYNECKSGDITAGRAVAETVIESGVDIAIGIGATALVTAAISAAGFVAAPAVLVGAAAAGITIGANAICKWATGGKDIGEVVADTVCNIGEGAVKLAKKATNKIKNAVSAPWKKLCAVF